MLIGQNIELGGRIMGLKQCIRKKVQTDPALDQLFGIENVLNWDKFQSGIEPVEGQFMIFYTQAVKEVNYMEKRVKVFVKHTEDNDFSNKNPLELNDWLINISILDYA